MSDEYYGRVPALNGVSDRFGEGRKVGRAESEAQIAALQAERNALREALAGVGAAHLNAPLLLGCLCDWCKVTRNLLSTPASGEPARKP